MGVRRAKSREQEKRDLWDEWIARNRSGLQAIGLPPEVYLSPEHWEDFLENGYLGGTRRAALASCSTTCPQGQQEHSPGSSREPVRRSSPLSASQVVARASTPKVELPEEGGKASIHQATGGVCGWDERTRTIRSANPPGCGLGTLSILWGAAAELRHSARRRSAMPDHPSPGASKRSRQRIASSRCKSGIYGSGTTSSSMSNQKTGTESRPRWTSSSRSSTRSSMHST